MKDIFCTRLKRCALALISALFCFSPVSGQELDDYTGRWVIMTRDGYSMFELSRDSIKVLEGRGYDTMTFTLDHAAHIDSLILGASSLTVQVGSSSEPFSITFKPVNTQTGKSLFMSGRDVSDTMSYCETELLSIDQVRRLNELTSLIEMSPSDFQTIIEDVQSLRNAPCKLQSSRDLEPRVRYIIKQHGYDPRFPLNELGGLLVHLKDNPISHELYIEVFE